MKPADKTTKKLKKLWKGSSVQEGDRKHRIVCIFRMKKVRHLVCNKIKKGSELWANLLLYC